MRQLLPLLCLCLGAGLASCGQKGDLYIPQDSPPATPAAPHATTAVEHE